jgi:hypothetical protein
MSISVRNDKSTWLIKSPTLNQGDCENAVQAYATASSLATYDVAIQFEYAVALSQDNAEFPKVIDQLMTAYRGIRPETGSDLIKNIYKGLNVSILVRQR